MMVETLVVDTHNHVGGWSELYADGSIDDFVRRMDSAGVDKACINHIYTPDATRANDIVARCVEKHPDRLYGVAYVTPQYQNEAIPELERAFDRLGMKYLFIPDTTFSQYPMDDSRYERIYDWVSARGFAIMCNIPQASDVGPSPGERYAAIADKYPNVNWVIAHSGNTADGQEQSVLAARLAPNVYLETCSSWGEHGTIEYLVEGAGEDRVLFGSDLALMDPRSQLGRIVTADISDDSKHKVLGLNAVRVLGLE